jgi:hypothetical protein
MKHTISLTLALSFLVSCGLGTPKSKKSQSAAIDIEGIWLLEKEGTNDEIPKTIEKDEIEIWRFEDGKFAIASMFQRSCNQGDYTVSDGNLELTYSASENCRDNDQEFGIETKVSRPDPKHLVIAQQISSLNMRAESHYRLVNKTEAKKVFENSSFEKQDIPSIFADLNIDFEKAAENRVINESRLGQTVTKLVKPVQANDDEDWYEVMDGRRIQISALIPGNLAQKAFVGSDYYFQDGKAIAASEIKNSVGSVYCNLHEFGSREDEMPLPKGAVLVPESVEVDTDFDGNTTASIYFIDTTEINRMVCEKINDPENRSEIFTIGDFKKAVGDLIRIIP